MLKTSLIIIMFTAAASFGQPQPKDISPLKLSDKNSFANWQQSKKHTIENAFTDSVVNVKVNKEVHSKKSPGLAMIYSLIVPGMGQAYTKRFDVGKYFLISEAALWLGFASFTVYGSWLVNDAYDYSVTHAGVIKGSKAKDDDFWINIANYDNADNYNNEMLEQGNYDKVYYPGTGYDFHWNSVAERKAYRDDKLAGDRITNDRLFFVGAVLINHIISAISAIVLTNNYNNGSNSSGGVVIKADVIKNFNRVDGIKLNLTKWF